MTRSGDFVLLLKVRSRSECESDRLRRDPCCDSIEKTHCPAYPEIASAREALTRLGRGLHGLNEIAQEHRHKHDVQNIRLQGPEIDSHDDRRR